MGKLAIMSDLHVDINDLSDSNIMQIVNYLNSLNITRLHVAGDIHNNARLSLTIIDFIIEEFKGDVTFNWGNHDMLNLEEEVIEDCRHPNFLNKKAIPLNEEVSLVGYNGWYDYGYGTITNEEETLSVKNMYWVDRYIQRGDTDKRIDAKNLKELEELLNSLEESNKKVILATHFVPNEEFILKKTNDAVWNMCNAFLGSKGLEELLASYKNIQQVVFGHTHFKYGDRKINNTIYSCRPLGYIHEWGITKEFMSLNNISDVSKLTTTPAFGRNFKEEFNLYKREHFIEEVKRSITIIDY